MGTWQQKEGLWFCLDGDATIHSLSKYPRHEELLNSMKERNTIKYFEAILFETKGRDSSDSWSKGIGMRALKPAHVVINSGGKKQRILKCWTRYGSPGNIKIGSLAINIPEGSSASFILDRPAQVSYLLEGPSYSESVYMRLEHLLPINDLESEVLTGLQMYVAKQGQMMEDQDAELRQKEADLLEREGALTLERIALTMKKAKIRTNHDLVKKQLGIPQKPSLQIQERTPSQTPDLVPQMEHTSVFGSGMGPDKKRKRTD